MKSLALLLSFLLLALGASSLYAQKSQTYTVYGMPFQASIPQRIPGYGVSWNQVRALTLEAVAEPISGITRTEAIGRLMILADKQSKLVHKEFAKIAVRNKMDVTEIADLFLANHGESINPKVQQATNLLAGLTQLYDAINR